MRIWRGCGNRAFSKGDSGIAPTISRSSSESSCCGRAVEPTKSQNMPVSWRRSPTAFPADWLVGQPALSGLLGWLTVSRLEWVEELKLVLCSIEKKSMKQHTLALRLGPRLGNLPRSRSGRGHPPRHYRARTLASEPYRAPDPHAGVRQSFVPSPRKSLWVVLLLVLYSLFLLVTKKR